MSEKCPNCEFINHGIQFMHNKTITICSEVSHVGHGEILVLDNFDPKHIDVDKLIYRREEILDTFRSGNIFENCKNCIELNEKEYDIYNDDYPKIKILMLQHWTKCNSKCIYCYTSLNKDFYNKQKTYDVYPILKELIEQNVLDKNGIANFSGGEVSCLREFKKVVSFLNKLNYFIIINSSGVKYERTIEAGLKKGSMCIIISVDAGSQKMHKAIKRVNTYDKVWDNIKRYVKNQKYEHLVNVKYIIIPNVNDTEEEINLWLDMCKKANVKNVVLGIDANYFVPNRNKIKPYILELFYKTRIRAEEMGFSFYLANRATIMLTQGKYADSIWDKYKFDEGPYSEIYFKDNKIK